MEGRVLRFRLKQHVNAVNAVILLEAPQCRFRLTRFVAPMCVNTALAVLLWLLLFLGSASLHAAPASNNLANLALDPHPGARLPFGVELVDEAGRRTSLGSFFGRKPVVLVLQYLRCKWVCGLALGNLAEAGAELPLRAGRDYAVLAVSIDPRDTPQDAAAAKAKYGKRYGPGAGIEGWHFLTGPEAAVRPISEAVGFHYRYDPAVDQYIHSVGYAVVAADGTISGYLTDIDIRPAALQAALAAAAAGGGWRSDCSIAAALLRSRSAIRPVYGGDRDRSGPVECRRCADGDCRLRRNPPPAQAVALGRDGIGLEPSRVRCLTFQRWKLLPLRAHTDFADGVPGSEASDAIGDPGCLTNETARRCSAAERHCWLAGRRWPLGHWPPDSTICKLWRRSSTQRLPRRTASVRAG